MTLLRMLPLEQQRAVRDELNGTDLDAAEDLDDEAAMQHFQVLINESTNALFPQFFETTHRFAQYWR